MPESKVKRKFKTHLWGNFFPLKISAQALVTLKAYVEVHYISFRS
jgi:hypothetical protein